MMLEVKNIYKTINNVQILHDVSFIAKKGSLTLLQGHNGAGKSSVLKILACISKPSMGEVILQDAINLNSLAYRKKIGYLGHEIMLYSNMSPKENLLFFGRLYGVDDINNAIEKLSAELSFFSFINQPVWSLSKGMKQRVSLARALIHRPQVLLLDEPLTGLDQSMQQKLLNLIAGLLSSGTTIIMAVHNVNVFKGLANQIVTLKRGKIEDISVITTNNDIQLTNMMESGGG